MSSIIVRLFSDNSIARYYQIATLAAVYEKVDPGLRTKIRRGVELGFFELSVNEFRTLADVLTEYVETRVSPAKGDDCGPTLYTAGHNDRKILSVAGIEIDEESRVLRCKALADYHRGGLLLQKAGDTVDTPMFLRAYVFSMYRGSERVEKSNVASLYLALAGSLVSSVGRVRRGGDIFELYLLPDGSPTTLSLAQKMYYLLNEPRSDLKLNRLVQDLVNLEGVSLELAATISVAMYTHYVAQVVLGLRGLKDYYNVFERFKLVCVKPEDRPLVVWDRALTLTHIISRLESTGALDVLDNLRVQAGLAPRVRDIAELSGALAACINDVYGFLETGSLDTLTHCSGGLIRTYDALDKACKRGRRDACMAAKVVAEFLQLVRKLGEQR